MSRQAKTWVAHTRRYLEGVDPPLAGVFMAAMTRAGYPGVSAADALEAICADFLAGPVLVTERSDGHETAPERGGGSVADAPRGETR